MNTWKVTPLTHTQILRLPSGLRENGPAIPLAGLLGTGLTFYGDTMPYQIVDWTRHYENSKSRERDRCSFICVPNKQNGLGLARLLMHEGGLTAYGLFHLIAGLASQQSRPREGWMTDNGKETGAPWTLEGMAVRWRLNESEIEKGLGVLCSPSVGWIKCPPGTRPVPASGQSAGTRYPTTTLERKERKGKKEGKERKGKHLANGNGAVAVAPEASNFQQFMDGLIKDYLDGKPGDPDPKEKANVTALYKRFGGAAKEIMAYAKQDPILARKGFEAVGRRLYKTVGDNWTMFAVPKHFSSWKNDPEGYETETKRIGD